MELKLSISEELNPISIEKIASFIVSIQKENGEIPWSAEGKTDPWDHVESAMGLSIGGFYDEARHAYEWRNYPESNAPRDPPGFAGRSISETGAILDAGVDSGIGQ